MAASPFVGELRVFPFASPPPGWALCNGQLLAISDFTALYSIIGTTYGGNGTDVFALPDLQGRVPMHAGAGFSLGQAGGEQAHTLTVPELPQHNHAVYGTAIEGNIASPAGANLAEPIAKTSQTTTVPVSAYGTSGSEALAGPTIAGAGGGQSHNNMAPYLVLSICIATTGIFPTRTWRAS